MDMKIVKCAHTSNRVTDSRENMHGIRRRRECTDCGYRWTTLEMAVDNSNTSKGLSHAYRRQVKRSLYRLLARQFNELADDMDRKGLKRLASSER